MHPLRNQARLALDHGLEQGEGRALGIGSGRIEPKDDVVHQLADGRFVAAGAEVLEGADPDVARGHAREHCTGQGAVTIDRLAGGHHGE